MAMTDALCAAVADGNKELVNGLIKRGVDVNMKSSDGFLPLCLASFWGYSEVVKLLLEKGADVNGRNSGTQWTACHCAAFQGHGKVIMTLLKSKPNVTLKDDQGRTAVDFASALDSIWPHFAALGYQRTSKQNLIQLKIVEKTKETRNGPVGYEKAYFSRPGSAYVMKPQGLYRRRNFEANVDVNAATLTEKQNIALSSGDVLNETPNESMKEEKQHPSFSAWRS